MRVWYWLASLKLQGRYVLATFALLLFMLLLTLGVTSFIYQKQSADVYQRLSSFTSSNSQQQLELRSLSLANYLADAMFNALYNDNLELAKVLLMPVIASDDVDSALVLDLQGHIFHDGSEHLVMFGEPAPYPDLLSRSMANSSTVVELVDDELVILVPIQQQQRIGTISIEVSLENVHQSVNGTLSLLQQSQQKNITTMLFILAITALALMTVGGLLAWLMGRTLTQPMRELIKQTDAIGRGEFHHRLKIRRKDEVGELGLAFNSMQRRLKQHTRQISHLAFNDDLTSLPKRSSFIDHVDKLIAAECTQSFAVLFIDLDNFKDVNDTFGHAAGDKLLQELAQRLTFCLRGEDLLSFGHQQTEGASLISRVGGDEFLICIESHGVKEHIVGIIDRLSNSILQPVTIAAEQVVVGCSIGVSCYPEAGDNADQLIKHADIAMYDAKRKGKNTYSVFSMAMTEALEQRLVMERLLRSSLSQLDQFECWYQPKVSLVDGRLLGAEALVRWRHPERGLIFPDQFIEIAEDSGMIIELGLHIIEQQCRQLDQWREQLPAHFHIALNLSAQQLYRQALVSIFTELLQKYQIKPTQLHCEITESLLMHDEKEAEKVLSGLRQLGMEVWLDDFGTGYSSLSYLRRFPVDGVKIDRSFVSEIETNYQDRALSSAIISMASDLELGLVAEGVETQFQAELLAKKGCKVAQGYYFDKPLPADVFFAKYLQDSAINQQ